MNGDVRSINFLLIDDEPASIQNDIDDVINFLEERGYASKITPLETTDNILQTIKTEKIDIVLTDKNIEEKGDGLEVVKKIRSEFKHLDILFYSADQYDREELDTICEYGSIEIVEGREIIDRLQTLVEKNISQWENMNYLRGIVISRIIEIEMEVNEFIEKYFAQQGNTQFRNFILENKHISLDAKKKILSKIIEFEKVVMEGLNKLTTLQEKRNLLAHCKVKDGEKNKLVHMGDDKEFTRDDIYKIFDDVNQFSTFLKQLELKIEEARRPKGENTT